jgi:lipid II:glycine glycyltransferase (peptidoglycan interpeptide bridge formation enzyme)
LAELQATFPDFAIDVRGDGDITALPHQPPFASRETAVYHRVPLNGRDAMWRRLPAAFRRNVRQAQRKGISVRTRSDPDAVASFYALYTSLRRRRFGILTHPIAFFHLLHANFVIPGKGFFLEALLEDQIIASFLILRQDAVMYYKFPAYDPSFLACRPNNLLLWDLLERASMLGCAAVDLGMTRLDKEESGLLRFKDGLGGERRIITRFRMAPSGYDLVKERNARTVLRALTDELVQVEWEPAIIDRFGQVMFQYFT